MNNVKTVRIPFDGQGKSPKEAAKLISSILEATKEVVTNIVIPTQWAWEVVALFHPYGGLVKTLENKESGFSFTGFKNNCGELGVTATRVV